MNHTVAFSGFTPLGFLGKTGIGTGKTLVGIDAMRASGRAECNALAQ